MKPLIAIIHDTRRSKQTACYPVKLRVTFMRRQQYYPVGIDMTIPEFNLMENPGSIGRGTAATVKRQIKEWKLKCDTISAKADSVINKLDDFTFKAFERKFFQNQQSAEDVYQFYDSKISKLKEYGKVGTASNYECSMNSLKTFSSKLSFREVTVEVLNEYERWFLTKGKSISTVGIYLRPLRAIINQAVVEGLISKEHHYPFGKGKYQIPSAKNIKKALTMDELSKIYHYNAVYDSWQEKARDFFIFSYLGSGINMKDIALLRFQDLEGEFIHFKRAKTLDTTRTGSKTLSIHISADIRRIIDRWKNQDETPENYLFPILQIGFTPDIVRKVIQQFTKMMNKHLNVISSSAGINKHITTYYARHSFATVLKRNGTSIEMISESLGHSSQKTTSSYLDSFEDDTKKEMQATLLSFKTDASSADHS